MKGIIYNNYLNYKDLFNAVQETKKNKNYLFDGTLLGVDN